MQKLRVYPCGYIRHGALIDWLMQNNQDVLLIEARRSPQSKIAAWEGEAIRQRYDKRYRPGGGSYLGNLNYNNGGPIQIAEPVKGIQGLIRYLQDGRSFIRAIFAVTWLRKSSTSGIWQRCEIAKAGKTC